MLTHEEEELWREKGEQGGEVAVLEGHCGRWMTK